MQIKEKSSKRAGSDFEVWVRQTFQESSKNFSFAITPEGKFGMGNLVWKRVDGKFKMRLGEIPLTTMDFSSAHAEIFDTALNQIEQYTAKLQETQSRESSLMNDLTESRNQMIQLREDKDNFEEKLFDAFLPILNSKKDEIRRLKRKVS